MRAVVVPLDKSTFGHVQRYKTALVQSHKRATVVNEVAKTEVEGMIGAF